MKIKHRIRLTDIEDTPPWMIDSEYLTSGYRADCDSFVSCFLSLFRPHNETLNIWTHFIGVVVFVILCFYIGTILIPTSNHHHELSKQLNSKSTLIKMEQYKSELEGFVCSKNEIQLIGQKPLETLKELE